MLMWLRGEGCYGVVSGKVDKPILSASPKDDEKKALKEWVEKDDLGVSCICMCLSRTIFMQVDIESGSKTLWKCFMANKMLTWDELIANVLQIQLMQHERGAMKIEQAMYSTHQKKADLARGKKKKTLNEVNFVEDSLIAEVGEVLVKESVESTCNLVEAKKPSYKVESSTIADHDAAALSAEVDKKALLWHRRLGHACEQVLERLVKDQMVTGIDVFNVAVGFCESCIIGKHAGRSFSLPATRASSLLELVHSDLCSPVELDGHHRSLYFMTLIDDFSRRCSLFFLRKKSQAFDVFVAFKARAENQTGNKIRQLRTDGGGEYISNRLKDMCRTAGIMRQITCRMTPQQNGVAERRNCTLVNVAKSMLVEGNLGKDFCEEAISTAAYVQNRLPIVLVDKVTPEELWTGKKPDVKHLRVFGCQAFAHVPKKFRKKFDAKSISGRFVGYDADHKSYKIYLPTNQEICICPYQDVMFNEDKFPGPKVTTADFIDEKNLPQEIPEVEQEVVLPTRQQQQDASLESREVDDSTDQTAVVEPTPPIEVIIPLIVPEDQFEQLVVQDVENLVLDELTHPSPFSSTAQRR
ncbi:hypothetical protein R1sor_017518 [Riccia sorocarpa]|uniref:Integrase catalytic domain-containing protein n=1 Tax=Riccia sorocarpa TaxID=122646 RepID=A0ABD3I864_9MARC